MENESERKMKYKAFPKSSEGVGGRGKPKGGSKRREDVIMNGYEASTKEQIEVQEVQFPFQKKRKSLMRINPIRSLFYGFVSNLGIELNSVKYVTDGDGREMKTLGKQLLFLSCPNCSIA